MLIDSFFYVKYGFISIGRKASSACGGCRWCNVHFLQRTELVMKSDRVSCSFRHSVAALLFFFLSFRDERVCLPETLETFAVTCFDLDESKGFGADTVQVSAKAGSNCVLLSHYFDFCRLVCLS